MFCKQTAKARGSMMKCIVTIAIALAFAAPTTKLAAQAPLPLNSKVKLDYAATTKFAALRDRLKARAMLEQYSQFLSPLQLKHDLTVTTLDCGKVNADYNNDGKGDRRIRLCYEY